MRDVDHAIALYGARYGWLPSDLLDQRIGDVEAIETALLRRDADG